jgi:MATE family multidrug resistance protein
MGHLSELHLGAVGLGSMIFNFLYWNFGFLRMGTTGMTAQAFGKVSDQEMIHTLIRGLLLSLVIALLILILQRPFADVSVRIMNASGDMRPLVQEYFLIRIWAAPATLALYVMMGWFFGMQNAVFPLILTLIINMVNISLSFYLVRQLNLGIAGVAWGTVWAQYVGVILSFALFWMKYRTKVKALRSKMISQLEPFKKFLRINSDIFVRTVFLSVSFGFFYRQSAIIGPEILAINVVLLQFVNWMSYGIDGFAFAAESLVGRFKGAEDSGRLELSIRWSMAWAMIMALVIALIYTFFGSELFSIFTDEKDLIAEAGDFLFWMALFPICGTPSYIWDGIFVGLTASKAMKNSMALSFAIYIIVYFLLRNDFGNHSLWTALILFLIARGAIQWYLYRKNGINLK